MSSAIPTNSSNKSLMDTTLNGVGNLIRLLPTGTVFVYQFLNPLFTNAGGQCSTTNKIFSSLLFAFCGLSCFHSTFTDSYKDGEGKMVYGIATFKGFWAYNNTSSESNIDLSSYKLQIGDFAHGAFAFIVFGVISLLDANTVACFYPEFVTNQKALLMSFPAVLGTVSGTVFMLFPYKRHGVGYPSNLQGTEDQTQTQSSSNGDQKVVHVAESEPSPTGDQKV